MTRSSPGGLEDRDESSPARFHCRAEQPAGGDFRPLHGDAGLRPGTPEKETATHVPAAHFVARAAYDRGLWIPDSLAIAGFNGDHAPLCSWQRLTTVQIPSYEMGRKAAEMALHMIDGGPDTSLSSSVHRPTLILGQTA